MSDRGEQPAVGIAGGSRHINWPLWVGASLAVGFLLVALIGPQLAPKDPREQVLIIQVLSLIHI